MMEIIPAIDLKEGKCVRLLQGDMDRATVFSDNPVETALRWEAEGGQRLHVVDLDGAFKGEPRNRKVIEEIIDALKIPVQVGGGIRDLETIDAYVNMGVDRVILGTIAHTNPELVAKACDIYHGRIVVGIDAKDGKVAIQGWAEVTSKSAMELATEYEEYGVAAIIYTDIAKDGMMQGPSIEATRYLALSVDIPIIASGGVSSLEDIKHLLPLEADGVEGVITGKAIYSGALDLKEAISIASDFNPKAKC
jgi:phosphoribosylformimino-5-aminoimidazole carboxamide ribotide isomerase